MTVAPRQRWDPGAYGRHARFVSDLGQPVLDLLDLQPGERVLDLGCGDGALTLRLLDRGAEVVGVDSSGEMVYQARALGIDARVGDGQRLEEGLVRRGVEVSSPWFFPDAPSLTTLLEEASFQVEELVLFPRPTPLPGDVGGWLRTFAQPFTHLMPSAEREAFLSELVEALAPTLRDQEGRWLADYVRLRFAATARSGQGR